MLEINISGSEPYCKLTQKSEAELDCGNLNAYTFMVVANAKNTEYYLL